MWIFKAWVTNRYIEYSYANFSYGYLKEKAYSFEVIAFAQKNIKWTETTLLKLLLYVKIYNCLLIQVANLSK